MLSRIKELKELKEVTEEDKVDWRLIHPRYNPFRVTEMHYFLWGFLLSNIIWTFIFVFLLVTKRIILP